MSLSSPKIPWGTSLAGLLGLLSAVTVSWAFLAFDDLGSFENSWAGSGRVPLLESSGGFLMGREVGLTGCGKEDRRGGVPSLSVLKSALVAQQRRGPVRFLTAESVPPPLYTFRREVTGPHPSWEKGSYDPLPCYLPNIYQLS